MAETKNLGSGPRSTAPRCGGIRRLGAGVLVVGIGLLGCTSDDSDDQSAAESPASTTDAPSDDETFGERVGTSDDADENADADGVERLTVDGMTFEYDPAVIQPVEPSDADSATGDSTQAELAIAGGGSGQIVLSTAGATAETTEADVADTDGTEDGESLQFVNGAGVRIADPSADPVYSFRGETSDSAVTVEVRAAGVDTDHDVVTAALDGLVASLFVDTTVDRGEAAACEDDFEFVSHVTVPDGTVVEPGTELTKTWRIRNSGECEWDDGWSWAFTGGDPLTILETTSIAGVAPDEEVDVSVRLRVPQDEGFWSAQWQPVGPSSPEPVGSPVLIMIETQG